MKVRIKRDLAEKIAAMSIPAVGLAIVSLPYAVVAAVATGWLMHDPDDKDSIEVEISPLSGMQRDMARRQFNDYVHSLRQMARFGTPDRKAAAADLLKEMKLG